MTDLFSDSGKDLSNEVWCEKVFISTVVTCMFKDENDAVLH